MVSISNIKRVVTIFILRPNKAPPPKRQSNNHDHFLGPNDFTIGVFRRCATMPTFPNHWAGVSGSIEGDDASPLDAALRELQEETNLGDLFVEFCKQQQQQKQKQSASGDHGDEVHDKYSNDEKGINDRLDLRSHVHAGLHVDILSKRSQGAFGGRTIRVYPFALTLPFLEKSSAEKQGMDYGSPWSNIMMRGTEHDEMKFVSLDEFLDLSPCVPGLRTAFHHATTGTYLHLPQEVREWEKDRVNGAASLARQAVVLAAAHSDCMHSGSESDLSNKGSDIKYNPPNTALSIAMLRPSMVPIVNAMKEFDTRMELKQQIQDIEQDLLESLTSAGLECVKLGVEAVMNNYQEWEKKHHQSSEGDSSAEFTIGTFSRSSTMKLIIAHFIQQLIESKNEQSTIKVICSQSTPGGEGELMADDIPNAVCLPDEEFAQKIRQGSINTVIVGADCILDEGRGVVNKVGTTALASVCKASNVPIICCADKWKKWNDIYSPPLEDIFELVPANLLDCVLVPAE